MEHVIDVRPVEILDWRQSHNTRQRLVKIDQPESKIEQARQQIAICHHQQQTDRAEEDMEQVIRRGSARETVALRYDEPRDTYQDQDRREDT